MKNFIWKLKKSKNKNKNNETRQKHTVKHTKQNYYFECL